MYTKFVKIVVLIVLIVLFCSSVVFGIKTILKNAEYETTEMKVEYEYPVDKKLKAGSVDSDILFGLSTFVQDNNIPFNTIFEIKYPSNSNDAALYLLNIQKNYNIYKDTIIKEAQNRKYPLNVAREIYSQNIKDLSKDFFEKYYNAFYEEKEKIHDKKFELQLEKTKNLNSFLISILLFFLFLFLPILIKIEENTTK